MKKTLVSLMGVVKRLNLKYFVSSIEVPFGTRERQGRGFKPKIRAKRTAGKMVGVIPRVTAREKTAEKKNKKGADKPETVGPSNNEEVDIIMPTGVPNGNRTSKGN